MVCYHYVNGSGPGPRPRPELKGASAVTKVDKQNNISFPETEISLVNNTLKIARFYISKNPGVFKQQDPQRLLSEVEKGLNIISAKTNNANNSIKGASSNICYKKQSFKNVLKHFSIYH